MATHIVLGLTPERASHGRKCLGCNEVPLGSRGSRSSSIVLGATLSGVRSTYVMIMDHIHRYSCSWHAIMLHDRVAHVVKEVMLEAGATKGWESCFGGSSYSIGSFSISTRGCGAVRLMPRHLCIVTSLLI
jgi:hypothetical protein